MTNANNELSMGNPAVTHIELMSSQVDKALS